MDRSNSSLLLQNGAARASDDALLDEVLDGALNGHGGRDQPAPEQRHNLRVTVLYDCLINRYDCLIYRYDCLKYRYMTVLYTDRARAAPPPACDCLIYTYI